jgi:hypothetical protein
MIMNNDSLRWPRTSPPIADDEVIATNLWLSFFAKRQKSLAYRRTSHFGLASQPTKNSTVFDSDSVIYDASV